jgi:hypothetical protein
MKSLLLFTVACLILSRASTVSCQSLPKGAKLTVLRGGSKLYEIENDSQRQLLLQRPKAAHPDTLAESNSNEGNWVWETSLEQDFKNYAVFTTPCGSNYCWGASVLQKNTGKFVWRIFDGFIAAASDRPDGEIVYWSRSKDDKAEIRIYDIATGFTEEHVLPEDMNDCPSPAYCIDSAKVNRKQIQLTYRPGDKQKTKTMVIKRTQGKKLSDN